VLKTKSKNMINPPLPLIPTGK